MLFIKTNESFNNHGSLKVVYQVLNFSKADHLRTMCPNIHLAFWMIAEWKCIGIFFFTETKNYPSIFCLLYSANRTDCVITDYAINFLLKHLKSYIQCLRNYLKERKMFAKKVARNSFG